MKKSEAWSSVVMWASTVSPVSWSTNKSHEDSASTSSASVRLNAALELRIGSVSSSFIFKKHFKPPLSFLFIQGQTGIGKSTLMNTLFGRAFEIEEASHYQADVTLHSQTHELQENAVKLKLTVVHTVGFGDQINNEHRCTFTNFSPFVLT